MKENTSRFSQRCCLQRALLAFPTTRPGQGLERERRACKRPRQKPRLRPGAVPPVFPYAWSWKPVVRPSTNQRRQEADEWLRRLSLAAGLPRLGPLPLEASLWKANSLSSICRQRTDLPPPPLSLSQSIYLDLHLSLTLSQSLSLSLSLTHTHTFCAYTLRFALGHISASAWLRSHRALFCFFADAS